MKIIVIVVFGLFNIVYAQYGDSLETKKEYASQYLREANIRQRMSSILNEYSKIVPELKLEDLQKIYEEMDWNKLDTLFLHAMMKIYSLDELKLLADFYTSSTGKSISQKSPLFMREVFPIIKKELDEGLSKRKNNRQD
jgi:hypothetical protein